MSETGIIVLKRGNIKYSFQLRLGLVNRVGGRTPKIYIGMDFKEVSRLLTKRGFLINKIII